MSARGVKEQRPAHRLRPPDSFQEADPCCRSKLSPGSWGQSEAAASGLSFWETSESVPDEGEWSWAGGLQHGSWSATALAGRPPHVCGPCPARGPLLQGASRPGLPRSAQPRLLRLTSATERLPGAQQCPVSRDSRLLAHRHTHQAATSGGR